MNETALTREKIIEAAEEVLRRYGPTKATVVDVARALGVSHGSVYRHFASKDKLREAVTNTWLARINHPLEVIVAEDAPAADRLHRWLRQLHATKRRLFLDESELFATYCQLATEARAKVIDRHLDHMVEQISRIIRDGVARGEFEAKDPLVAARAVLNATWRFHNPAHAADWSDPQIDAAFEEVWSLVLNGLKK